MTCISDSGFLGAESQNNTGRTMPVFDFSSQGAYYCSLVKVDLNITLEFSLSVQPFLCFLNQSGDV